MTSSASRIVLNRVRCTVCQDVLRSDWMAELDRCTCGLTAIDGGRAMLRRIGGLFEEQSVTTQRFQRANGLVVHAYRAHAFTGCMTITGRMTVAAPGDWITEEPEGGSRAWPDGDFEAAHRTLALQR